MPYGTLNADTITNSNGLSGNAIGPGFKNRIINGDMRIDQRNAGASVTPTVSAYTLDRWVAEMTQASKYSIQQNAASVTPPVGFTNYLGITSASAYSVLTGDAFFIRQSIEGLNVSDLAWGSASAKTVTLSFWVRSSLTGTFGGALQNSAADRSYPFTYTISAANTWELETITIAGDTSGTWLTTNGIGINVIFGLGVGSTYSGTAGAWAAGNFISATGATSVVGTSGATFYITGVQLEVAPSATSFDYRPYGTELIMCQRYFELVYMNEVTIVGQCLSTSTVNAPFSFQIEKRGTSTLTLPAAGSGSGQITFLTGGGNYPSTIGSNSVVHISVTKATISGSGYTSQFIAGDACALYATMTSGATPKIQISAEL